jgi:putative toxin-antitoxin system antitoxin component (TIGR02293 family)
MARHSVTAAATPRGEHPAPEIATYLRAVRTAAGANAYVALLGLRAYDTATLHRTVEKGLTFRALLVILRLMALPLQAMADLLLIPPRTLQRRRVRGRLDPAESDRLLRLSRIYGRAIELFEGDNRAALRWLATPLGALGGRSALALSRTEPGALEVERLVSRLEHGVFS